jgi:hypothetical protein
LILLHVLYFIPAGWVAQKTTQPDYPKLWYSLMMPKMSLADESLLMLCKHRKRAPKYAKHNCACRVLLLICSLYSSSIAGYSSSPG